MSPAIEECKVTNARTAELIIQSLEDAGICMLEALQKIADYETIEQRNITTRAVGRVLASDMNDLKMFLLEQYPSLDKHELLSERSKRAR